MPNALLTFAGIIIVLTICTIAAPRKTRGGSIRSAATHSLTLGPLAINYTSNPYRIGAYVYVMEDAAPSEHDWAGTFIGMSDGMAMVRDADTRVVAHVNRDQLYGAQR